MAAQGEYGVSNQKAGSDPYEEALGVLSSLILRRTRGEFNLMFDYVKILGLEEDISKMNIIHVAGTKGKYKLQEVWESRVGEENEGKKTPLNDGMSEVFLSLPLAIKWLRDSVINQSCSPTRFQVLVTGSLQLVGDVLRLVTK